MWATLWKYREVLSALIQSMLRSGKDPAVELRRMASGYEAQARGEAAWKRAEREKFGGP